jgi:hypothetical protein
MQYYALGATENHQAGESVWLPTFEPHSNQTPYHLSYLMHLFDVGSSSYRNVLFTIVLSVA